MREGSRVDGCALIVVTVSWRTRETLPHKRTTIKDNKLWVNQSLVQALMCRT